MGNAFRDIVRGSSAFEGRPNSGAGGDFSIGGQRDMLIKLGSESMDEKARHDFMMSYYAKWLTILDLPVPVIAAIECLNVAPVFAFISDIALADETTNFVITFAKPLFTRAWAWTG